VSTNLLVSTGAVSSYPALKVNFTWFTDKVRHRRRVAIQQVCQHRLQQASLYSQHTMTSVLHHD